MLVILRCLRLWKNQNLQNKHLCIRPFKNLKATKNTRR